MDFSTVFSFETVFTVCGFIGMIVLGSGVLKGIGDILTDLFNAEK